MRKPSSNPSRIIFLQQDNINKYNHDEKPKKCILKIELYLQNVSLNRV